MKVCDRFWRCFSYFAVSEDHSEKWKPKKNALTLSEKVVDYVADSSDSSYRSTGIDFEELG